MFARLLTWIERLFVINRRGITIESEPNRVHMKLGGRHFAFHPADARLVGMHLLQAANYAEIEGSPR